MEDIPLNIHGNHICARLSSTNLFPLGNWLIKTSAGISFGKQPIYLQDELHHVLPVYSVIDTDDLCKGVGVNLTGLLGADILNQYDVLFNLPNGKISFFKELQGELPGMKVPIRPECREQSIIEAHVEGHGSLSMIFDTGAQHSYLNESKGDKIRHIGRANDYDAYMGMHEVELYLKRVRIGTADIDIKFAQHPIRSRQYGAYRAHGILGWEILKHGPVAYLPRRGELWI